MKRYLTPIQQAETTETIQRVSVDESPVWIYRLDDGSHEVVAESDGRTRELGIRDGGVSRKKGDTPPVELRPVSGGLEVENRNSKNPIIVEESPPDHELAKGESIEITDDCTIHLGIEVQIRANVRDAGGDDDDDDDEPTDRTVNIEAHIDSLTVNIVLYATRDDIAACRNKLEELHDTIVETPVDDTAYDEITEQVDHTKTKLESKINDQLRSETIGDELSDEIDRLTSRVANMYKRN